MKEKIKNLLGSSKEIILNYKYTFILIVINTLLIAFIYDEFDYNEFLTALLLSNVFFFGVETYFKKEKYKIPLLFLSLGASAIFNHVLYETDDAVRIPILIAGIYISAFLLTIYKISQDEKKFSTYFLKIVNNSIIFSLLSSILQFGVLYISGILSELLFPNSLVDIMYKVEILFLGLFVVPGELICLTNRKIEVLNLIKILAKYILLPIVIISEAIIYSYFIKIIITNTIPSNMIFAIICILFIIIIPTYLLIMNYKDESKYTILFINKIPYTYIPLLLMAAYSIGVRIYDYGITIERYFGVIILAAFIIFTILSFPKNHKYMHKIMPAIVMLIMISMIFPYINCISISRNSQLKRLTSIYTKDTNFEELSLEEKDKVYSCYEYLKFEIASEKYLPDYIDTHKIENYYFDYSDYIDDYTPERDTKNIYYQNEEESIPVSGYDSIQKINIHEYTSKIEKLSLDELEIYDDKNMNENIKDKFKKQIGDIIEKGEVTSQAIDLNEHTRIYLDTVDIVYNTKDNTISSLTIKGYIMTKS